MHIWGSPGRQTIIHIGQPEGPVSGGAHPYEALTNEKPCRSSILRP